MKAYSSALLASVFSVFMTTSPLVQASTPEVSEATKAALEAQILALKDAGPAADQARKAIPVPVSFIAVDHTLSDRQITHTGAGVPRIVAEGTTPRRRSTTPQSGHGTLEGLGEDGPEVSDHDEDARHGRTVFGNDDRRIFHDHTYPFRTVGRVSSGAGSCTGTLVGPRHMLTASHCVVWNGDGTIGWLKFEASRYGSHHQGEAWASRLYYYRKVVGPILSATDSAFDFVVVVLDTRLGDSLGWMGAKAYITSWNGGAYWRNIGYPTDLGGSVQPVYQAGCAINNTLTQCVNGQCSFLLYSYCDIISGQSGSALYGYWDGYPAVVAVTSGETNTSNWFSGGSLLSNLIGQVRTMYP